MSESPTHSKPSYGTSAFSLTELESLSKKSPTATKTSSLVRTEIVSSTNSPTEAVSLSIPKTKISALEQFEDAVGGRQQLVDSLSLATLDKREAHFLDLLLDPRRSNDNITTIARDAGLKPLQVVDLYRSAAFAKAHAISMGKLSEALPGVVDDIAAKSVDTKITCPNCFGDGQLNGESCIQCGGRGEVMRFSDLDRQKIVLEAGGLTKQKSAGVNVNVQQNVGIMNPSNYFSKFVKDSDSTAYAVDDIVDAEVKD